MKTDWNSKKSIFQQVIIFFWRIPIMKTDWNVRMSLPLLAEFRLLAHSNYEDGLKLQVLPTADHIANIFWRIPIMKTDWNFARFHTKFFIYELLAHSNYEDGLKQTSSKRRLQFRISFGAFQLWRRIETYKHTSAMDNPFSFGAFQLWRRIETKSYSLIDKKMPVFWRIPIMKTDWNRLVLIRKATNNNLLAHSNYEDGLKPFFFFSKTERL